MVSIRSLQRVLFSALLILTLFSVMAAPARAQDSDPHSLTASRKPVFDRYFIDYMVPAHESAIALYEYALTKPIHDELRAVLEKEIATARAENEKMRDWRKKWYGSANTPAPNAVPTFPESPQWEMGVKVLDLTLPLQHLQMVPDAQFEHAFLDKAAHLNLDAAAVALIERHHDGHREAYDLSKRMAVAHTKTAELFSMMRDEWYFGIDWPEIGDDGTATPTAVPTDTATPTSTPTMMPSNTPTGTPTDVPTATPTDVPTETPTDMPTVTPTETATETPTGMPTELPTIEPTETGTGTPEA